MVSPVISQLPAFPLSKILCSDRNSYPLSVNSKYLQIEVAVVVGVLGGERLVLSDGHSHASALDFGNSGRANESNRAQQLDSLVHLQVQR